MSDLGPAELRVRSLAGLLAVLCAVFVLGGIKIEIGDEVIDGTIMRKIDAARRAMGA